MRTLPTTYWLRGPLTLLALASVVMVLRAPDERTPWWGISGNFLDVNVYRWGGHAVLNSIPLYDGLLTGDDSGRFYPEMPFTYPPFSAVLFTPLDLVTPRLMEAAWLALTLALLYLAVRMCLRALDYRPDRVTAQVSACLALIALSTEPVRTTVWLGQINILLLVLVLADHLAWRSGRRWAGIGSGLAAGVKLTPAFFWAHWILTGRWRMALTSGAAFLGTVALGFLLIPRDALRYWSGTLFESQRIGHDAMLANQSLRGTMARLAGSEMAPTWAWLLGAAVVAVLGLGVAALAHRAGHQLLALTVAGLTMTMVSPFSWGHHWVWFVPLLVLAVHYAVAARRWYLWLLPPLLWAACANWVQSFPDVNFPDDRWVAMGLFMLGGDIPPVVYTVFTNVYPLVWLVAVVLTALLLRRSGSDGARLRDYGTADDASPRAQDPRRG
ncbi:glycosyltransferase 87 family protein [Dietzia sp. B32]|uniref:glycosyltransferase 87 family protein n=1 Tax=Dietzia sp. B32 TaxID=2915130 RepID=UPI0021ADD05A|nr:glycosyltransferase 87 family protein [Dietzia sp. B32]UVE94236.1 glycosyltransferase 87 family protein [Dietzia sp. B32]